MHLEKDNIGRVTEWSLCHFQLGQFLLKLAVFDRQTQNNSGYISYVQEFFLAELWPLMLIIYSEPEFVGRDSCYKLLPPTFLCELSNKIDQTLQWIESRSNGFNRAQTNTNFNVHIFHDKIAEFATAAEMGDLKASKRGLIAGSDEGSQPVVVAVGNYPPTLEPLGISELALGVRHTWVRTPYQGQEQRVKLRRTGPNMWI